LSLSTRFVRGRSRPLVVLIALAWTIGAFAHAVSSGDVAVPSTPSVSTGGTSSVTFSSAILSGSVNAHGQVTTLFAGDLFESIPFDDQPMRDASDIPGSRQHVYRSILPN
jgi:hypothetical protein